MARSWRSLFIALVIVGSNPIAASADEPAMYTFTPKFDEADDDSYAERGITPTNTAEANADADRNGHLALDASVSGVAADLLLVSRPTAAAFGSVTSVPFAWAGGGVRVVTTFAFDADLSSGDTARVSPLSGGLNGTDLSVESFLAGEGVEQVTWESWDLVDDPGTAAAVVLAQRPSHADGSASTATVFRGPCEGMEVVAGAFSSASAQLSSQLGSMSASSRAIHANLWIQEIRVEPVAEIGCYETATVRVLDDYFDPAAVTLRAGDYIRFDATAANNYHDVYLEGQGYAWWGGPFKLESAGEFTYYCTVHGNADGTGMAGTLTVT